jgi:hypothetical protein
MLMSCGNVCSAAAHEAASVVEDSTPADVELRELDSCGENYGTVPRESSCGAIAFSVTIERTSSIWLPNDRSSSSSRGGCRLRDLLELDTADCPSDRTDEASGEFRDLLDSPTLASILRRCISACFVSSAICAVFSAACVVFSFAHAISTAFLAMSLSFLRPSKLCDTPLSADDKALEYALSRPLRASELRGERWFVWRESALSPSSSELKRYNVGLFVASWPNLFMSVSKAATLSLTSVRYDCRAGVC